MRTGQDTELFQSHLFRHLDLAIGLNLGVVVALLRGVF